MTESPEWAEVPEPPGRRPTRPRIETVPAGTLLHRVHGEFPADSFNPTASPTTTGGGRFDTLTGRPGYTYLGATPAAAIAETLCRDLPTLPDASARLIPERRVTGRRLTRLLTTRDLAVLSLHGPDLTRVGATLALTKSDASTYLRTRAWVDALLGWYPHVAGFSYRCRHDEDQLAYVLYDGPTRAGGALGTDGETLALDTGTGRTLVRAVLERHNAALDG